MFFRWLSSLFIGGKQKDTDIRGMKVKAARAIDECKEKAKKGDSDASLRLRAVDRTITEQTLRNFGHRPRSAFQQPPKDGGKCLVIAALVMASVATLGGCTQIEKIPDEQLASYLNVGTRSAVQYGLQLAVRKADPADITKIKTDAEIARQVVSANILPIFAGVETSEVLRSAVDTALSLLKNKIKDSRVAQVIDLAVEVIALEVTLPKNPAAKLDARTKALLNGVFTGIVEGIDRAFPTPVPAARETMTLPK
jgi:hypothetical protein